MIYHSQAPIHVPSCNPRDAFCKVTAISTGTGDFLSGSFDTASFTPAEREVYDCLERGFWANEWVVVNNFNLGVVFLVRWEPITEEVSA